jgi:hypothetical protein
VLAREHRVPACLQVGTARQFEEQPEGVAVDAVLAVVDVQVAGRDGELLPACRVLLEELSKMDGLNLSVMITQFLPGSGSGDV